MQCQKTGAEQKYFTTFQTIRRVTQEEGVNIKHAFQRRNSDNFPAIYLYHLLSSVLAAVPRPRHTSLHRRPHQRRHLRRVRHHGKVGYRLSTIKSEGTQLDIHLFIFTAEYDCNPQEVR